MTSQLSLIHSVPEPEPTPDVAVPTGVAGAAPPATPARSSADRSTSVARRVGSVWHLDRRTIDRGRRGVAEARAELRGAAARAHQRELERHESRLAQLQQLRRPAAGGAPSDPPIGPSDPGPSHRAA